MLGFKNVKFEKAVLTALTLLGAATMAQSANAGEYWALSNAPITYKMANPADMTGFNVVPQPQYAPPLASQPGQTFAAPMAPPRQMSGPQMPYPSASAPVPGPSGAPVFDPSRVDQNLYPHQRIGKTYTVAGKSYTPRHQPDYDMVGTASWYGDKFHGKLTANGEKYDKNGMTAAHKTLPLNSLVVVTNLQTGVAITLRINDRGPFIGERIIDLSEAAATIMGIKTTGLGNVRVQYAGPAAVNSAAAPQQFGAYPNAPSKQALRPMAPAPAPLVLPQIQQPAPAPMQPGYQPLRNMGHTPMAPTPQTAQMQPPQVNIPNVMNPVSIVPKAALPAMPYSIPEAYIPPQSQGVGDDTVVTMTISGPIHMAGHQVQGAQVYFVPSTHLPIK